jgi:hypothetical protein
VFLSAQRWLQTFATLDELRGYTGLTGWLNVMAQTTLSKPQIVKPNAAVLILRNQLLQRESHCDRCIEYRFHHSSPSPLALWSAKQGRDFLNF